MNERILVVSQEMILKGIQAGTVSIDENNQPWAFGYKLITPQKAKTDDETL